MSTTNQRLPSTDHDAVVTFDGNGTIESVNRKAETLFGYTENELAKQHICMLLPEGYRAIADNITFLTLDRRQQQVLQQGLQVLAAKKDQTLLLVNIKLDNYMADGGIAFRALISDVAAQAIPLHNPLGALQSSSQQIILFDAVSLFIVSASDGALHNLQFSPTEICTRTVMDLADNLSTETFEKHISDLGIDHRLNQIPVDLRRKNATVYEGYMDLQPAKLGTTPVYIGFLYDRQSKNQTSFLQSPDFSDRLISTLKGIVLLLDTNARILQCNDYFEQLSGYSKGELEGLDWFDTFIQGEERDAMRRYFKQVFKSGGNDGHINGITTKDGTVRQIQWHSSILKDTDGHEIGLLCTGYDVTQQLNSTALLEQAIAKTELAAIDKSRFLAAASHDLRQPLQSLGMYLSALSTKLETPKTQNIANKMQQSLTSMRELLDALLDISRFDSGSVQASKKSFALQPLLDRIITDNVQQAKLKGINLTTEQHNYFVNSDPGLLERVLENLVTNATRYTTKGEVQICCTDAQDSVSISVRDTGVGIPAEHIEHVFDEYYQLDDTSGTKTKGLGLGLAIVRHIATLLDHPINVTSEVGVGTTFTLSVPKGEIATDSIRSPKCSIDPLHQPTVLLVDDDPSVVDATIMLLESENIEVVSAGDGGEALDHIRAGTRPDILITDFRLPGYNGVELVKRTRQALQQELPAILMTGDTSADDIVSANLHDCTVLHKPVSADQLLALIGATYQANKTALKALA